MTQQYIIGIDVGGTNTDAVLLCDGKIIASAKTQTTTNINIGIAETINKVLESSKVPKEQIHYIMIGTTHLLNATLQNRLSKVAAIRLGLPATTAIPPCTGWPSEIEKNVKALSYIINGGYEYDGKPISDLNKEQLIQIANELKEKNIDHVAITGVFSHINPTQENDAAKIIKEKNPNVKISLSHELGGLGLLERENATILNTALLPLYQNVCNEIQTTLDELGLNHAKICLSHNDGTIDPIETLTDNTNNQQKPIFTFNAGPVNSLRGAACIAKELGIDDLIVADIGGTSTDVGIIRNGALIEENNFYTVAGIPLNLPSIRTKSIGLGGGSIIKKNSDSTIAIGPESVSNRLMQEAICFGGKTFTATDIAVLKGRIKNDAIKITSNIYSEKEIEDMDNILHKKLAAIIEETWLSTQQKPKNLMLVGGGSYLFDRQKLLHLLKDKISNIIIPENAHVANALGAAQGEISGTHTQHFDFEKKDRQQAINEVYSAAVDKAIKKGADPKSIKIKFRHEDEIQYVPGKQTLVTVKVSGNVKKSAQKENKPASTKIKEQQIASPPTHNIRNNVALPPEIPPSMNTVHAAEPAVQIKSAKKDDTLMTHEKIKDKAIGHGILGSGGGGDTRLPAFMVNDCIKNGKEIKIISLESIADDEVIICFGIMGSPSVTEEKLPSKEEITKAIIKIQEYLKTQPQIHGKKITAVINMEIGGANGLIPLVAAAELGLPVADGDCMGRALPEIKMVTPIMTNSIQKHIAVLANATSHHLITAESAGQLEQLAREKTDQMGGITFIAYMPMLGKTAKAVCIPGTHSVAEKIGAIFNNHNNNNNMMASLNEYLKTTEYKEMKEEFSGRIGEVKQVIKNAYTVGGVICTNDNDEEVEVIFKNEYLKLRKKLKNGYYEDIVTAPNLIVITDSETRQAISCSQLKYGQCVRIFSLKAPSQLLTTNAEKVVGPKAYNLDESIKLLHPDEAKNASVLFTQNKERHTLDCHSAVADKAVKNDVIPKNP